MNRLKHRFAMFAQFILSSSWLFVGGIYMLTPRRMAEVLGMPSGMREAMGFATALPALVLLVATVVPRRALLAPACMGALTVIGCLWLTLAITRHWGPFVYFYAILTAFSAATIFLRAKAG